VHSVDLPLAWMKHVGLDGDKRHDDQTMSTVELQRVTCDGQEVISRTPIGTSRLRWKARQEFNAAHAGLRCTKLRRC
jgi:hypothetical protein